MCSPDPGLDLAKRHQRKGTEEIQVQEPAATWKSHFLQPWVCHLTSACPFTVLI